MKRKRAKLNTLLLQVRSAVRDGTYRDTYHSGQRYEERTITRPEMEYVLLNGWHERKRIISMNSTRLGTTLSEAKQSISEIYGLWSLSNKMGCLLLRQLKLTVKEPATLWQ